MIGQETHGVPMLFFMILLKLKQHNFKRGCFKMQMMSNGKMAKFLKSVVGVNSAKYA